MRFFRSPARSSRRANVTTPSSHPWTCCCPAAGTIYAIAADPLRSNANLGLYTVFVDLLDLTAIVIAAGFAKRPPVRY
jgi:hypothetical protein